MAWAITQSKASATAADGIVTTFDSTPSTGSLLLAASANLGAIATPVVTDSNGSWTLLHGSTRSTTLGLYLYGKIAVASQPTAITADISNDTLLLSLYELSGGPSTLTGILDPGTPASTNGGSATTTSGSQPSITTAVANSLVVAQIAFVAGSVTSPTLSDGTYTGYSAPAGAIRMATWFKLGATVGSHNPSASWTTSRAWLQNITGLKEGGAVASTSGLLSIL